MINASRLGLLFPDVIKRRVKIRPFYRFFTYRSFGKILHPIRYRLLRNFNRLCNLFLGMTGQKTREIAAQKAGFVNRFAQICANRSRRALSGHGPYRRGDVVHRGHHPPRNGGCLGVIRVFRNPQRGGMAVHQRDVPDHGPGRFGGFPVREEGTA